ncbi:Shaggy-related protein kinase theta [Babesia microti strain RI]|uniref:Shaggy-related protein kinase theta n=1 Tax=Babesia microti (strain RI) TaxID=1133968 RepID=A0A1N6LWW3_BABMR|nr:Shaggy-related protein kinase theta [Babesia microti strain RI]SIO73369.1 Shaggy-related protein kinase theta [Babesia microti strain RI]|eukprot:XP_021337470.1 Shaggy-related protein kinase theta [Babesia microti strain RI]
MDAKTNSGTKCVNDGNNYTLENIVGYGSFGVVHIGKTISGEIVAIKKVLQDPRYKNRELSIMKDIKHPNIVELKDYFYTETVGEDGNKQKYLNVVMEFVPDTVYKTLRYYIKNFKQLPLFIIKMYAFQLCRALGYLHLMGICHRDLKPHNLLVNPKTHKLKLCDFGSAKKLVKGEWSVAYICSRFYRAPELMLGTNEYTTAIDTWSIGCVIGELFLGKPLFAGDTGIDQLVKIIQVLGTPNKEQMYAMNPNYCDVSFPDFPQIDLATIFPKDTPSYAIDFINKFLQYDPTNRIHPLEALSHPFFEQLKMPPDEYKNCIDESFFQFTKEELCYMSQRCKSNLWTS